MARVILLRSHPGGFPDRDPIHLLEILVVSGNISNITQRVTLCTLIFADHAEEDEAKSFSTWIQARPEAAQQNGE